MQIKKFNESTDNPSWKSIQDKIVSEMNLNMKLVGEFGFGIGFFYPIVSNLVKNMNLDMPITNEMIVMLTICVFCVLYKDKKENISKIVEEIRLNGIFHLLKPILKSVNIIKDMFNVICQSTGKVIKSLTELFSYTAMFVPMSNLLSEYIKTSSLNMDTLQNNLLTIGMGIITITGKHIICDFIDKINSKLSISKDKILSFFKVKNDNIKTYSEFSEEEKINDNYLLEEILLLEECSK